MKKLAPIGSSFRGFVFQGNYDDHTTYQENWRKMEEKLGYIKEIPIKYHIREYGSAKINFFDGIESVLVLMKFRYFYDSKVYQSLFNIYKYYFKKIVKKILKKF